jgi:hypothetical protein
MPPSTEEKIATLRELIERADDYAAMSAPVALFAGSLATAVSLAFVLQPGLAHSMPFEVVWLAVLGLSLAAVFAALSRDALERRQTLLNRRSWFVLRTLAPVALASAAVTAASIVTHMQPIATAGFWMIFYGLALLALAGFAPRPLLWLGWIFLLSGIVLLGLLCFRLRLFILLDFTLAGYWIMGATFGLYHAACAWLTWPRAPGAGGGAS